MMPTVASTSTSRSKDFVTFGRLSYRARHSTKRSIRYLRRVLLGGLSFLAVLAVLGPPASAQSEATVTVDPNTVLVDGQSVEVRGSGVASGSHGEVVFWQCAAGLTAAGDCDPTTARYVGHGDGEWVRETVVWREIDLAAGPRDCAVEPCEIVVSPLGEFTNLASTPISFDPAVAANPRPSIVVDPSDDLIDEQVVTVEGTGFSPFERLNIVQCSRGSGGQRDGNCSHYQNDSAEVDGTFSTEIGVHRLMNDSQGGVLDCADGGCSVLVLSGNSRSSSPVELHFDPAVPIPPAPRIAVRPHRGLVDGEIVKVVARAEGIQWGPVLQCAVTEGGVDYQQCLYLPSITDPVDGPGGDSADGPSPSPATTDVPAELATSDQSTAAGVVRVRVQLRREIRIGGHGNHGPPPQVIDCAESAGRCALVFRSETHVQPAVRSLHFDRTVPALKAKVTIEKRNGLVSGEKLKVGVSNSLARSVQARQCPRDATTHDDERCQVIGRIFRHGEAISTERFVVVITPRRLIGGGTGEVIDCAEKRACDIRISGSDGPMRRLLVNFAPSDAPGLPTLRVAGRRGLNDGQAVKVRVLGPKSGWVIWQCQASARGRNRGCVRVNLANSRETAGATKGSVSARRFLGSFDCAETARSCELRLAFHKVNVDSVPLVFDSSGPTPEAAKVSVRPRKNLVDQQTVAITLNGHAGRVNIQQCAAPEGTEHLVCRYLGGGKPDDGQLSMESSVSRFVAQIDCAERAGRCVIRVSEGHGRVVASTPLRFDPDGPLPPEIIVRARPRKDLVDFQSIEIIIKNRGDRHAQIRQCAVIDGELAEGSCRRLGFSSGESEGADDLDSVSAVVRRELSAPGAETAWDCAQRPGACVVAVDVHGEHSVEPQRYEIALRFDPDGPAPAQLAMKVRPRRGLADGQTVRIRVDALDGYGQLRQCPVIDGELAERHCVGLGNIDRADGQKATVVAIVHRTLTDRSDSAEPFDCALVKRSCVVVMDIYQRDDAPTVQRLVTLNFDPDRDPIPLATRAFSFTPNADLANGQEVLATGTGFRPGLTMFVLQCVGDEFANYSNCQASNVDPFTIDGAGSFSVTLTVAETVRGQSCREVGCRYVAVDAEIVETAAVSDVLQFE